MRRCVGRRSSLRSCLCMRRPLPHLHACLGPCRPPPPPPLSPAGRVEEEEERRNKKKKKKEMSPLYVCALDSPLPAPKRERPVCCRRCLSVTCAPRSSHAEATSLVPKLEAAPFFPATELRRRKILGRDAVTRAPPPPRRRPRSAFWSQLGKPCWRARWS
ncbi:hypothetical protein PVAP13_3KG301200 [Panicum virgatum]|uniref:Uncharacterized protein n=1 Tax=Panicum virgatum TaxID=38727 RepID=A0A8T0UXL7_PANVG|nr:hypothetical protein PVAP13_3KG301200 [Panicum virgatum]